MIIVPLPNHCALANFWSWRPWNGILNLLLTRFKLNKSKVSVDCDFHKLATDQEMLKLLGMRAYWSTNNKTKKSFSPIGCALYGKSYRFVKIWCLPYYCLMIAWWLADNCKLPVIIYCQSKVVCFKLGGKTTHLWLLRPLSSMVNTEAKSYSGLHSSPPFADFST